MGIYAVKEQEISSSANPRLWESCITMSHNRGYIEYDTVYKSSEVFVSNLLENDYFSNL